MFSQARLPSAPLRYGAPSFTVLPSSSLSTSQGSRGPQWDRLHPLPSSLELIVISDLPKMNLSNGQICPFPAQKHW